MQDRKLLRDKTLQQLGDWSQPLEVAHEVRLDVNITIIACLWYMKYSMARYAHTGGV